MERVVIIGGTAAGAKTAATARRRNPDLAIHVFQADENVSYSACGMPYFLSAPEDISLNKLVARTPEEFAASAIDVQVRHLVEEIDFKGGRVEVRDLEGGKSWREPFDKLCIATGARPIELPVEDHVKTPHILYLRDLADIEAIDKLMSEVERVVIIGGGYIGLEMAEALEVRKKQVTIIDAAPRLLPNFEPFIADRVVEELKTRNVELILNERVASFNPTGLMLEGGAEIKADMVLVSIGVKPETALAEAVGIKLGATGAIVVDEKMRTNLEGVYAAGDCTECRHMVSGQNVWVPLGDIANRQGRVAGTNIAGGNMTFPGILATAIFKVFDLAVATTGLRQDEARLAGIDACSVTIETQSRARYINASAPLHVNLVAESGTGRILGCQVIGRDGVDKLIETVATAIWGQLTVEDLINIDLAYAPPFSPVISPVQVVAQVLSKKV